MGAPQWMVIGAASDSELATAKASGMTHGLVEVKWDQVQPTNGAVDASGVLANISRIISAGMKVILRVSPQYIPSFVDTAAVKFRRNGSVNWTGVNADGNNIRDWVWSASTRALVDDFLTKLFNQLNWSVIDGIQLGGLMFGELSYPTSDGTQWWGYSSPAQTGTDLAVGQVVCPVPGHVPSTGSTWSANDISFNNWYQSSLRNWMLWLIAKHRLYTAAPIWVMHPGSGLRPNYHVPTSSDSARALGYREQAANGLDWAGQIAAYPDANVHPYSTWANAAHNWPPDPYSDVNDGNAAPWYHLLRTARAAGRANRIWGENTGGQTNSDLDTIFTDGAVSHGYQGLVWLSHTTLSSGTAATYSNFATRITKANKTFNGGLYRRGLNMAGGEFAHVAATLPGTYGTDYSYDSAAALANVGARGHKVNRFPIRWERLQPTRNAALNSAELARITQYVADSAAAGMPVLIDVHNYGEYIVSGGATLRLGTDLPTSDYVDFMTRLSVAFKNNANVLGYDPMNEPHDLAGVSGSFTGAVRYDWNDGTVQGWTGDTATSSNVGSKLRLSATATSGYFNLRKDDTATLRGGAVTGNTLQATITLGGSVAGNWRGLLQWQNSSFQWQNASTTTYTRLDNGQIVSGLIAGVAIAVRATWNGGINSPLAFAIQLEADNATAGAVTADIDDFTQGSASGGGGGSKTWETISQQVVTAIRNNGDTKLIVMEGHGYSSAKEWVNNHPTPWINDPANNTVYSPHYYFDVDNSGDYPDTYATENTAAVTNGYSNLASRVAHELTSVMQWAVRNGVRLWFGEIGWTNTADTASWNAVGEALYDELDRFSADATYWAAGERWGTSYNLSLYTGTTQTTVKAQASVVEAHLTTTTTTPGTPSTPTPPATPLFSGVARNLFPNPALAVDATGYVSTPAGYVRSTSVNGGLSRATGLEGTIVADVNSPRAQLTAGQQYVFSFDVAAIADQSFNALVNFYAAASGGTFISNSGATVPVIVPAGQVRRIVMGPYTAPTGTLSAHIKWNDIDAGGVELTAIRCTPYTGDLTVDSQYFDGSSPGATWDGTTGASTSTFRIFRERGTATDLFNVVSTPLGPVASDIATATESFTIVASGTVTDQGFVTDGFLIAELEYDDGRGRVRISAFTFSDVVTQVRVQRRPLGGKFEDIRGGRVAVLDGTMNRPVDDYEYPAGVDVEYRIQGLDDRDQVRQQAVARRSAAGDVSWLKFVANPQLNHRIHLTDWSAISRDARSEVFEVVGRSDPVVVSDVHGSRRTTVEIITPTVTETKALDEALSQGHPVFLQVPADLQLPTMYATVGNFSYERLSPKSVRSRWSIPLIEVAPPPMTLVGSTSTYASVLAEHTSYADILENVDRYRDLVA
jgi:hypothetical protein